MPTDQTSPISFTEPRPTLTAFFGAKPADLPVQLPTKSEMTINLRSAKALGIAPQSIMLRADEVIE